MSAHRPFGMCFSGDEFVRRLGKTLCGDGHDCDTCMNCSHDWDDGCDDDFEHNPPDFDMDSLDDEEF